MDWREEVENPPKNCPGFCPSIPTVLSEIQGEIREIQVEFREAKHYFQEHLHQMEALCPKHESRIRGCEDFLLKIQTLGKALPWVSRAFWAGLGISLPLGVYVLDKFFLPFFGKFFLPLLAQGNSLPY